jgi:hypothetical protein
MSGKKKAGKSKREEIRDKKRMQGDAETIMGQIPQLVDDDDDIDPQMETSTTALEGERPRLRVRIKKYKISLPPQRDEMLTPHVGSIPSRWHAIAAWRWDVHEDSCGICRMQFDTYCVDCKKPGDECPPSTTHSHAQLSLPLCLPLANPPVTVSLGQVQSHLPPTLHSQVDSAAGRRGPLPHVPPALGIQVVPSLSLVLLPKAQNVHISLSFYLHKRRSVHDKMKEDKEGCE